MARQASDIRRARASRRISPPTLIALAIALACGQQALASSFSYEGRLDDAGQPASGLYDIQITPFAAASDGSQLGSTITFPGVKVSDGRFQLEFDAPVEDSAEAWLQLAVRDVKSAGTFVNFPDRVKATSSALIGQCWSSTGDAGTNQAVNFLGTTDANPLVLRTNNTRNLQLEASTLLVGGQPLTSNFLAGGSTNQIMEGVRGATISGGGVTGSDPDIADANINRVLDHYGTVGGGVANGAGNGGTNMVDGSLATVGGGRGNGAVLRGSTVGGGEDNIATGVRSTISGGFQGRASNAQATVVGGFNNTASGLVSTAGGGANNCAGGEVSWAGGSFAQVRPGSSSGDPGLGCAGVALSGDANGDEGTFAWADSVAAPFRSTGPNQFLVRAGGGVGVNTTNIPSHADLVLTNRATAGDNVDLVMRSTLNNNGYNFAMSPDPAGAALFLAQYNGTTFTNRLQISSNGDFFVTAQAAKPGGGSWAATSDARLKSDVRPLAGALDQLLRLRGVTFRYTDPDPLKRPAGTHNGLIAQEVAKVFPAWVSEDKDGYLSVGSQGFEALAVEALRDLRAEKDIEIKALALENAELRKRLEGIEATLSRLTGQSER